MATGFDRVKAAFKGGFADTVPAYPILGCFASKLVGATPRQYLQDARVMADAQLKAYELYSPDIVVVMGDLLMEAEALGTAVEFPEDSACQVSRYALSDDKGGLSSLKVPDPASDGRMPVYLEACKLVKSQVKDAPVSATLVGPWAIAASLRGIEQLIYDTADDPGFVRELLEFTTGVAIAFGEAVIAQGVSLSYSEATVSCSVISPGMYREFAKPYHQRIVEHFKAKKAGVTYHVCGYIDPIMRDLVETGAAALSIDALSSLEKMMEEAAGRSVIIGNVPTTTFESGTRDDMEAEVRRCIGVAAARSGYILSSGCEVPPTAPVESVEWFMDAARRLGTSVGAP